MRNSERKKRKMFMSVNNLPYAGLIRQAIIIITAGPNLFMYILNCHNSVQTNFISLVLFCSRSFAHSFAGCSLPFFQLIFFFLLSILCLVFYLSVTFCFIGILVSAFAKKPFTYILNSFD